MSGLEPFRQRLDGIDEEIARLLGERFEICREVARYKEAEGIPMTWRAASRPNCRPSSPPSSSTC
jgi:chorismate mutase